MSHSWMYHCMHYDGVATISRLFKKIGLFCKRALYKRRYSAKETYYFKEPTNRSHPPCAHAIGLGCITMCTPESCHTYEWVNVTHTNKSRHDSDVSLCAHRSHGTHMNESTSQIRMSHVKNRFGCITTCTPESGPGKDSSNSMSVEARAE